METPVLDAEGVEHYSKWTTVLRTAHEGRYALQPSVQHIKMYVAMQTTDPDMWRTLWEAGFFLQVLRYVKEAYFCGFSKEELIAQSEDPATLEYVTWLLQVCRECLIHLLDDELPDSASPDAVHEVHEIFKSFPMFFKVVWDIRRPLLTSNYCRTTPILPGFNTVYLSLIDVGQLTNQLISKITPEDQSPLTPEESYIPHVAMMAWAYSLDRPTQERALDVMTKALARTIQRPFYQVIARDGQLREQFSLALLRELKDGKVVDQDLQYTLYHAYWLRIVILDDPDLKETALERKVFWRSLHGFIRHFCSGNTSEERHKEMCTQAARFVGTLLGTVAEGWVNVAELTEEQFYTIIVIIANIFVHCIEVRAQADFAEKMVSTVMNCMLHLKQNRLRFAGRRTQRARGALAALRGHAHAAWQRSAAELMGQFPGLRDALRGWLALGPLIPAHDAPAPFAPLERCAWAGCACSALRPAHRLKVCTRCWVVAYCAPRCQKSDWENHKSACSAAEDNSVH